MISCVLALIVGTLVIVADQFTKNFIVANYTLGEETHNAVKGLINITYIHNKGGAWGMLNTHPWILLACAALIAVICVLLLIKYRSQSKLMFWALTLILSGGIGNLADRAFRSFHAVVDFIQFDFWQQFPIFNLADCAVCAGAGLLVLFFIIDTVKSGKRQKQVNSQISGE